MDTKQKIRTLGGSLDVSAIGLGCMGMSYGYTPLPDKKEMIYLIQTISVICCPVSLPKR